MGFDQRNFANSIVKDARLFSQFKSNPQKILGDFGLRISDSKAELVKKQIEKVYDDGISAINKVLGEF